MDIFVIVSLVLLPPMIFIWALLPFRHEIRESGGYLLFFLILAFIFFLPFIPPAEISVIQKDANLLQIPFLQSYADTIHHYGQPPLWNPYLWGGITNLAHPLSNPFQPFYFLALLLPAHQAFNLTFILMVFLAAVSMYLFVRELDQERGAAMVAATVYAFNEFTLDRIGAPAGPGIEYLYSYAAAPLSLALLWRSFKRKSRSEAVFFGLSLVLVLNGNPNWLYYTVLLCGFMLVYHLIQLPSWTTFVFNASAIGIGLAVMLMIDSLELLPFLDLQRFVKHYRLVEELTGYRALGINFQQIPNLFLPSLKRPEWPYATRVGWLGLILAVLSLWKLPQKKHRGLILIMLASMILACFIVSKTPLYDLFNNLLPLFSQMSMVPGAFIFLLIPLAVLAGVGALTLIRKPLVLLILACLITLEIAGASYGWHHYPGFRLLQKMEYEKELADFPHLAAVIEMGIRPEQRIECRGQSYRLLCPEYAVMHYRLRTTESDHYLFPAYNTQALILRKDHLSTLDVRYILSPLEINEPGYTLRKRLIWDGFRNHKEYSLQKELNRFTEEHDWDGIVYIYEAERSIHAFIQEKGFTYRRIANNSLAFEVTRFTPLEIELQGETQRGGTLFVSEFYLPGWKVQVDGSPAHFQEISGGFMGVTISPGQHAITLTYDPPAFKLGIGITLLSVFLILIGTRRYRWLR